MGGFIKVRRALLSVSDKTGLESLARELKSHGVEILASGGTGDALHRAHISFTKVEDFTGNPEVFDGRMKTISFKLESAILFDRHSPKHVAEAENLGIPPIDLVVCNFYPFEKTLAEKAATSTNLWDDLIHQVDVGGPTMVRAAAKNHGSVVVMVDPSDYRSFLEELRERQGQVSESFRKDMMVKAFQYVLNYDAAIFNAFSRLNEMPSLGTGVETAPATPHNLLPEGKSQRLRYGENSHQRAVFVKSNQPEAVDWQLVDGKGLELSYNNILDGQAAFGAMRDAYRLARQHNPNSQTCAVAIVKHQNPCGLAVASDPITAFERAWAGDPISAFGGVIAFSSPVTKELAERFESRFVEVLMAPAFEDAALETLRKKKKKLRLVLINRLDLAPPPVVVRVDGGWLWQDTDDALDSEFQTVTKAKVPAEIMSAVQFGVVASKWVKSNAITLVRSMDDGGFQMVGMGSGQPNRVDAIRRLAIPKAEIALTGMGEDPKKAFRDLVLASDAFFPFSDNIEEAAQGGVRYIVQPGGSVKDDDVIEACDRLGIAMVFTGRRHFRH